MFPDTPTMALHRGRIDLLEKHLRRDPKLLSRTFSHREIYPAEMGCGEAIGATVGTPLGGSTLLHMCADYDEMEIARWLLDNGMDVNARSAVGATGFGGYTALFATGLAAQLLDELRQARAVRRAVHEAAARSRGRSECAGVLVEAASPGAWRYDAP